MNRFWILKNPDVKSCFAPASDLINIPLFEISSNPTIPFRDVLERRFNLIERAQERARRERDRIQNLSGVPLPDLWGRTQLLAAIDDDCSFFDILRVSEP